MKNQTLSIEQMTHLKSIGVDVSNASMVLLFIGEDGEHVGWEVENHGMPGAEPLYEWWNEESEVWESTHKEYFDAETGGYDHSFREDCGVFTLQDMLEMIPKKLQLKVDEYNSHVACLLTIDVANDCIFYEYRQWGDYGCAESFSSVNLLDAAYQMLCWLAENGHLKGGKQ